MKKVILAIAFVGSALSIQAGAATLTCQCIQDGRTVRPLHLIVKPGTLAEIESKGSWSNLNYKCRLSPTSTATALNCRETK